MKILFLDHDGVVCLYSQWGSRHKKTREWVKKYGKEKVDSLPASVKLDNFDTKAVNVLNQILTQSGAEIVVSSDWKLHATLEEIREMYKEYGVIKSPLDFTPNLKEFDLETASLFSWKGWLERARVLEIEKWLHDHPETTSWVAVDDLNLGTEGLKNFVLTPRSTEGIKQTGVKEKIFSFLK